MDVKTVKVEGEVARETVSSGSKSEREAVVLTTPSGDKYVLRRQGGPAFADPGLGPLVGQSIEAEGLLTGNNLIMRDWKVVR